MRAPTDRQLVERLRRGDDLAVAELAAVYGPRIHQLAFRCLKNKEDAEEVAQDVLMQVTRKIDDFRGDSALSSWIYRITFNAAISRLRNGKAARLSHVRDERLNALTSGGELPARREREPADWSSLGDEHVLRGEMRRSLLKAVLELPAIYRAPIVLRDLRGLSTEEASAVLKVKGQTLKSRLHRGRIILRRRLSAFAGGLSLHEPMAA
jgi:RNA polymerase sigma-70 factor (ECF subfamily)